MPALRAQPPEPFGADLVRRGLTQLAADQCLIATRVQLEAAGVTRSAIAAEIAARRWRSLNEMVVALHNGPLTIEQEEWAVLLSAPSPSALCGLTALRRAGLLGFTPDAPHVLVRRGAKVPAVAGVRMHVHESRRFDASDVYFVAEPRRVSHQRAVIDAAAWTRSPREAVRIVVAAVQQRLTTPQCLVRELAEAGRVRHARVLKLFLLDLEGGAQALSEVEFVRFCRRHGFPKPDLNHRCDSAGRRRYLDAVFALPDGGVVRAEIDGGIHLNLMQRWLDNIRENDLFLEGRGALRFASVAIYTNDPNAIRQLRQAMNMRSCQTRSTL